MILCNFLVFLEQNKRVSFVIGIVISSHIYLLLVKFEDLFIRPAFSIRWDKMN